MPAGGPRAGTGSCTSAEMTSTGGCYKIQVFRPHSHPPPPTSIQSYLIYLWCRPGLVLFKNSPCNSDAAKAYTGRQEKHSRRDLSRWDGRRGLSSGWSWQLKGGGITQGLETVAEPPGSMSGEYIHFFKLRNNLPQLCGLKQQKYILSQFWWP